MPLNFLTSGQPHGGNTGAAESAEVEDGNAFSKDKDGNFDWEREMHGWRTWVDGNHWTERIISFNASWFTVSMGTGVVVQCLYNFPYPSYWLHNLAYCFWVATMCLFIFFSIMSIIRLFRYPKLTSDMLEDFNQTSYLGAIPITLDTITVGLVLFYHDRQAAVWAAFVLFWIDVALSLAVLAVVAFVVCIWQEAPQMKTITGVWLLSFIPCLVTSSVGAAVAPYLPLSHTQPTVLIVSFLLWSTGICSSLVVLTIYFWRLTQYKLPVRDAIISTFIPVGPTGMGAYSIQNQAVALSTYISKTSFTLSRNIPSNYGTTSSTSASHLAATAAVAEVINWLGLLIGLCLAAFATFWLLLAIAAVSTTRPRHFNVGFWAFVFPVGVYALALCELAADLDNGGWRGWAATCCVATVLLWLFCAAGTVWKAVWLGRLFFAPGLEGWNERRALGMIEGDDDGDDGGKDDPAATRHGGDRESSEATRTDRDDDLADGPTSTQASPAMTRQSRMGRAPNTRLSDDNAGSGNVTPWVTASSRRIEAQHEAQRTSRADGTYALRLRKMRTAGTKSSMQGGSRA